MEYRVLVNNEELTDYTIIPLTEQTTLDESLDQGYIKLSYTDKNEAYRPFTSVDITVTDEFSHERELNYFIASDNKTEIIANGKYNHELLLIEQSKWLERFLTGTKTVTNPLIHDYMSTTKTITFEHNYARPNGSIDQFIGYYEDNSGLEAPQLSGYELTLPTLQEWFDTNIKDNFAVNWTALESGELTIKNADTGTTITTITNKNQSFTMTLEDEITLEVSYWLYVSRSSGLQTTYFKDIFTFSTIDQLAPKPNKTITDAVNDLLATIETIRESETPRLTFNSEQATKYAQIDAPEFTLTGTLWEALKQIGSYIHAIPRLKGNVIYFDELGGNDKVSQDLSDYVSNTERFDIEQYATAIDSTIQNVVTRDDITEGVITDPVASEYRTPRTETGKVVIDQENMFIQTKYPIEQIVKVEVGYLSDGSVVGDITPYVYEATEYETLSSYQDTYPYAKAYAIRYTNGQKNITELNFKRANPVHPVFSRPAILNIISRVTGKQYSVFSSENLLKLQFRVTYIPISTERVKQKKQYIEDLGFDSVLPYNQSAQKISSTAYGEAMKGAIARMGNPEITKMYIFNDLTKIPKVGQLFDDEYYISVVKCEYYKDFVKCQIGLSKNFNKLNEYVGIKSEIRFYEISEKQAVDRQIIYEDYCVVGDLAETDKKFLITKDGILKLTRSFSGSDWYDPSVNAVIAQGDDNEPVILPVISYGLGNSMVFTFKYDDNYSAGEFVTRPDSVVQTQLRYTDLYGEIDTLELNYGALSNRSDVSGYNDSVTKGDALPKTTEIGDFTSYISTNGDGLVVKKDNREVLSITYQVHFVANRKSIILGEKLTKYLSLVRAEKQLSSPAVSMYILPREISKYDKKIDLTNATEIPNWFLAKLPADFEEYLQNPMTYDDFIGFSITNIQPYDVEASGKSWVLVDINNELIIGENVEITEGEAIEMPNFVFTRKIQ